jgi:hypothetical protein
LVTIKHYSTTIYYLPGIPVSLALYPHNVNKFVLIVSNFYVAKVLSQQNLLPLSPTHPNPNPKWRLLPTPPSNPLSNSTAESIAQNGAALSKLSLSFTTRKHAEDAAY